MHDTTKLSVPNFYRIAWARTATAHSEWINVAEELYKLLYNVEVPVFYTRTRKWTPATAAYRAKLEAGSIDEQSSVLQYLVHVDMDILDVEVPDGLIAEFERLGLQFRAITP